MKNVIITYTADELEVMRTKCNFTKQELQLFNLRNEQKTLEECAEEMHISTRTAGRINKMMMRKITNIKPPKNRLWECQDERKEANN